MRLPNKVIDYESSAIALFPPIIEALVDGEKTASALWKEIGRPLDLFVEAMDCLFALGVVELAEDRRKVRYAGGNNM